MRTITKKVKVFISSLIATLPALSLAGEEPITEPMISAQVFEQARNNNHWKSALATGKQAQVVFMNISASTNPSNEIGMETHQFDQVIFVVEGNGNAILNGKTSAVKAGDMIFIPLGTPHNVVNLNQDKPLKIISVYSNTDIPAGSLFLKKTDEPQG